MAELLTSIFTIIYSCLIIGIFLSAPMGPIGILCVQRTMNNGRNSGFFTGVGAAISDLFYCLLTGLGLSIVINFINDQHDLLQMVGSAILMAYALYMIIHTPKPRVEDKNQNNSVTQDIVTGFLFTLSNPLIIFLIFPLFARFNFASENYHWYHYIFGYASIVVGALLWWWVITYFVDKVRARFSLSSMFVINRVIGVIMLLVSIYGLFTGVTAYFDL